LKTNHLHCEHADDFVLLAKEETVLQDITAGLIQGPKTYAVKINGGGGAKNENLKETIRKSLR
jgi:hypothetical protein